MSGFGVSYLIGFNMYLAVGLGIIFGSTTGVTINIHRDRDIQLPDTELSDEKDLGGKSSGKVSQKGS